MKLGKYLHSKSGKEYEVIGVARHSEDLGELVIYKALYESKEFGRDQLWARPKENFEEIIEMKGEKIPRFKYIGK